MTVPLLRKQKTTIKSFLPRNCSYPKRINLSAKYLIEYKCSLSCVRTCYFVTSFKPFLEWWDTRTPPYLRLSLKWDGFVSAISCSAQHLVCKQLGMGRDLPVASGIVAPCGWLSITIAIHFCGERLCCCAGTLILPPIPAYVGASTSMSHGPPTVPCSRRGALWALICFCVQCVSVFN